jgi:hypothetical protein
MNHGSTKMIENLFVSDQDLRWRTWQQKSRLADQRSEKRMKIVFFVVAGILLAWALCGVYADSGRAARPFTWQGG